MKKVFGTLAVLAFILLLGTVGSVELDRIPLGAGMARMAVELLVLWVSCKLSGAFEFDAPKRERHPRA